MNRQPVTADGIGGSGFQRRETSSLHASIHTRSRQGDLLQGAAHRHPRTAQDAANAPANTRQTTMNTRFSIALLTLVAVGLSPHPLAAEATNLPVVLAASPDWIPLRPELEIAAGSALDFSAMGFVDAPAGKHGRVIARPDGQFAFADSPDTPRRFYGVNLCFNAQYLSRDEANRIAERLVRLGYNALRLHHYEQDLTSGQTNTTRLNPQKLDQLDGLMEALIRRGVYITTDLYVSRSVPYREVGIDRDGRIAMDTFKILVPVHKGAFENWKAFTRSLLDHVNPYTNRRYAEEPALAWLALINEGNFGNFFGDLRTIPEWTQAWNRWLTRRYPDRAALAAAWGDELQSHESPADSSVALPESLSGTRRRARDTIAFFADTERDMLQRMTAFLREELGCHALLSNANSWTYYVTDQSVRALYDYVDDHFYVDHPRFLERSWRLPSRCPNTSPIADGATGGRSKTFTRLLDKPFTISEYNFSGPGRFRGVGGILTGALGALQGWGGIWRFAYSHSREALFTPSRMGYFDLASDPLSQAAERASLCLFLRGDLQTAPHSVALAMTDADLQHPADRIPSLAPRWHWLAWVTRVGTRVAPSPHATLPYDLLLPLGWESPASAFDPRKTLPADPYAIDDDRLWTAIKEHGLVPSHNATDPVRKVYQSETGQILIDAPRNLLVLDTPRTAGGFAPLGQPLRAPQGGIEVATSGTDATVWVSALDRHPIRQSRRLLVTHLTDLQNTGIRYAEPERQTLQDWGLLPYLVRAGKADLAIRLDDAHRYQVWALDPGGKRLAQVPARAEGNTLRFQVDVAGDTATGARMLYELAIQ